jgi:beta-glucosidase-like glycosyl hydrolase
MADSGVAATAKHFPGHGDTELDSHGVLPIITIDEATLWERELLPYRLLAAEELFRGTLSQTAVYPREVARRALERNAAAVILAHNHPSGLAEPSRADRLLTDALKRALGCLDIPVLDHLIVAGGRRYSFAENGLL